MELLPTLTVTITLGNRSRVFTVHEFASALSHEALPGQLVALVLGPEYPQLVHEESGGKGVRVASLLPSNAERFSIGTFEGVSVLGREGGRGKGNPPAASPAVDNLAWYLADKLHDPKSLAWYRRVARSLDRSVIDDALRRALDLEPRETRRSRAALFTAIVRPYLTPSSPRPRYAPPSPSP
jgi:hypothetical protein